jgi:hypothetical protein
VNTRLLAGVAVLGGSFMASLVACATEVTVVDDDGSGGAGGIVGTGGSGNTTGTGGAQPPPPPPSGGPGDGPGYVFAISRLYMGSADRNGSPDPSAWKQYGYDLDGKTSTAESSDLCQPVAGGSKSAVYPDGDGGIDNAWGKLIFPIMQGLSQDVETQINTGIRDGQFTKLLRVAALGSQADYVGLDLSAYEGAPWSGGLPAWNGTDAWQVTAESVSGGDLDAPLSSFSNSYVNAHTLVSAPIGTLELGFGEGLEIFMMPLRIDRAVVTMELSADRATATRGVIAGIVRVEPFIEDMRRMTGAFDVALCSGTTFESIADQIRQASDILADGTQDPARDCDAMSIGIGFEATAVSLSGVATPVPPPPEPCGPMP